MRGSSAGFLTQAPSLFVYSENFSLPISMVASMFGLAASVLKMPNVLQMPARGRQALHGSRLLPVPQDLPVCYGPSRPPLSSPQSSLLLFFL
jgi:hypothetical protein